MCKLCKTIGQGVATLQMWLGPERWFLSCIAPRISVLEKKNRRSLKQKSVEQVYNWKDQTDVCFNDVKT